MAALNALMRGNLPPVGQRVLIGGTAEPPPVFAGYRSFWTSSGTVALALALKLASRRRLHVRCPRVVLPAYGCPDLITAACHAGVEPVLVDLAPNDPGYDLDALERGLDERVVAVVAVNFLGIRERLDLIAPLVSRAGALLIEDCAQWYPEGALEADAVVLSFGRGKPVNLLGGGALLLRGADASEAVDLPLPPEPRGFAVRAALFNALLSRRVYALASRLPGLRIGATEFRILNDCCALDAVRLGALCRNARAWESRSRWREEWLADALAEVPGFVSLPRALAERTGRLLRYPVLFPDPARRDHALGALTEKGLGASALYGAVLPTIRNVPASIRPKGPFRNAQCFADGLLTLPLHDGVKSDDLGCIAEVLGTLCAAGGPRSKTMAPA